MAEWSKAVVSKATVSQGTAGSNPAPSVLILRQAKLKRHSSERPEGQTATSGLASGVPPELFATSRAASAAPPQIFCERRIFHSLLKQCVLVLI